MNIIKSDRITILPIMNKKKQNSLNSYFEKVLIAKNQISNQLNSDSFFQDLLFSSFSNSNDRDLLIAYYSTLVYPIFSQWEMQKFVCFDFIDKEKNRIEQFFLNWKPRFEIYKHKRRENTNTKLSQLMILIAKNYFYNGYFDSKINEMFLSNQRYLNNERMIRDYVERNILKYKYKRKPIDYTTSSIIKCDQRILGKTLPRMIKDNSNKLHKHWLAFDYIDENLNKEIINLPLAYNESYHQDFKQYKKSLSTNKYKGKNSKNKKTSKHYCIIPDINKNLNYRKTKFSIKANTNSDLNYLKLNKDFEVLFEREVQISLSKNRKRLTLTLSKELDKTIEHIPITDENCIGIDIGGSIDNTLVNSKGEVVSFKHLSIILDKLEIIDKLPDETTKEKKIKGNLISLVSRINESYINLIIKDYLDCCDENGIKHLVFEKLDRWSVKWKREKDSNQKFNRIFQLLRQDGIVNLFKKQARNRNIFVHQIPSYYTSQMCSCCYKIEKKNLKEDRRYICECGLNIDRDENASKNIKYILERFSSMLCKMNSYGEYESIKYISKEFTKKVLLGEKVKNFSTKSCV